MGGITPGILMGCAMMIVAVRYGLRHPEIEKTPFTLSNLWEKFVRAIGALLMPVIILGGIYGGIFTPTEAAGVACAYGLIVGVLKRIKECLHRFCLNDGHGTFYHGSCRNLWLCYD